jgi:hypothetical protein
MLAQAAAIAALGFLLLHLITGRETASYRTVTQPDAALSADTPALRVVFAAETPAARVHQLLQHVGGIIRAGPSPAGVYTIELTPHRDAKPEAKDPVAAADWLRAQTGVLFAEALGVPPSH